MQLDEGIREFYLRIEPEQFRKMKPGVRYKLAPIPQSDGPGWSVNEGLFVIRR